MDLINLTVKRIVICVVGIILSFILVDMFTCIDVYFTEEGYPGFMFYDERIYELLLVRRIFQLNYVILPAVFALTGLIISLLDRSEYRMGLVVIGLLPLAKFYYSVGVLSSSSGIMFVVCYFAMALTVSYLVPAKKGS